MNTQRKQSDNLRRVKVILIGDSAVGKTSVALRFAKNQYQDFYQATIAASFWEKTIESNGAKIIFQIWDTAGSERYRSLIPIYARRAEFAIVMYDVTSKKSFENVSFWSNQLIQDDMRYVLVGNKIELEDKREVSIEDARAFAEKHNMYFSEVSARTGENIERCFRDIAKIISADKRKSISSGNICIGGPLAEGNSRHKCCK